MQVFAITLVDDEGNTIKLNKPAKRIISLAPDITEMLYAIGAGEHIVGVIAGSNYPEEAQEKPLIGAYNGLNLEAIIRLQPDFVITWHHMFARELAFLKKLGIPIYHNHPRHIADVAQAMQRFGVLTGLEENGRKKANDYLATLQKIQLAAGKGKKIRVYYQIGQYGLFTINQESWISEAIAFCGGENVFAQMVNAGTVSYESLVRAAPEVIFGDVAVRTLKNKFKLFNVIPAVKHDRIFTIPADHIDRASPRLVLGVAAICEALKPLNA